MAALVANDLEKSYGGRPVLAGADLRVAEGEHLALVGPNGCGKSTLLGILAGEADADGGTVHRQGRVAYLSQIPKFAGTTVGEVVEGAVAWHGQWLARFEAATREGDEAGIAAAQGVLDAHGWSIDHRIDGVLDRLSTPERTAGLKTLSGGELRRVALASVLLQDPDLLLLDEPTNHLDADAITWLEKFLVGFRGALVVVSHDRYVLETVADRIVEVEDGELISYDGSYTDYLVGRAERHSQKSQHRERLMATIAREAAWASRSPSARTTKQRARLDRLDVLRSNVPAIDDRSFQFTFRSGVPSGVTLAEWHDVSKSYGDRLLFRPFDDVLRPGDRVGILGPNGCGKSTLLKTLTGVVVPDHGQVLRAARTKVGVLDQERSGLPANATLFEAAGGGNDHVKVGDEMVHVASFLGRFAFDREALPQRVSGLSGGERARLLLARLMLSGANLLLLDEPTNDLDLDTLRTLEEALLAFDGAVVVVSHDRAFVDRVCTRILAFEPDGSVVRYASRSQWLAAQRPVGSPAAQAPAQARPAQARPAAAPTASRTPRSATRLSYRERQELDTLPDQIETLEQEQRALEGVLADPATYRDRSAEVPELTRRLTAMATEVEALFARWEALQSRS